MPWISKRAVLVPAFLLSLAAATALTLSLRLSPQGGGAIGFIWVCSHSSVPAPTLSGVLTTWAIEPIPLVLLAWVTILYLVAFRLAYARIGSRRFSRWRAISFLLGMGLVMATVAGPLCAFDGTFLTVHMIQHFILITVAPPLLLAGAPMTALLVAVGKRSRTKLIYPITHAQPFYAVTHPVVGVALFLLVPTSWYVTPLFTLSLAHDSLHWASYALFLFAGLHYWWPIVGGNPTHWHLPHSVRVAYLFALVPVHAFLGMLFYGPDRLLYPELAHLSRSWGPAPLFDQQIAGMLMMVAGEAIGLVALLIAAVRWANADQRAGERYDRETERRRSGSAPEVPIEST